MPSLLSRLFHVPHDLLARLHAVLPTMCALCGSIGGEGLCRGCHAQFFTQAFDRRRSRCRQCAIPLSEQQSASFTCGDCLKKPPAFDFTIVAADYAPPLDQLVLALKFGHRLALAPVLAGLLRDAARQAPEQALPELLTAVPLGPRRLRERGFNQAVEIVRPLSRALGIPFAAGLVSRVRETHAQALLHPDERHRNLRNAFIVPHAAIERIRGRHVGVVDDVVTTGETLNELAACLKRFGAARVSNFVFARTLPK